MKYHISNFAFNKPRHLLKAVVGSRVFVLPGCEGKSIHTGRALPLPPPRTIGIGLQKGPRGLRFLRSEIPLLARLHGTLQELVGIPETLNPEP